MPTRHLLQLSDLRKEDILAIWQLARQVAVPLGAEAAPLRQVAWPFEGPGTRTRTSVLQAFGRLGLGWIELPGLLKTDERVSDLAGCLDPFFDQYVVRESDHARLLPTPPSRIGREWACDPVLQPGFLGHAQKHDLLPVQRALVAWLLLQQAQAPRGDP